jgi:uncharacterized YccA/Bax inhibitor family protein
MRTANPALNSKTFKEFGSLTDTAHAMSLQGTVNKTAFLALLLLISSTWIWKMYYAALNPAAITPWMIIGAVGGFIAALVTIFKKQWAAFTAPVYSVLEGLFLGGISAIFENQYPGIVIQAVSLTLGTLFCLLLAYRSGLIKVTENFKLGIVAATGGIGLIYLATLFLGIFGINMPFIHESGAVGIGFSLFVVTIAALNLVLDFDFIESGVAHGAPKYMEWYAAFGLMVTLIWLYIEILRLLAKLRDRR